MKKTIFATLFAIALSGQAIAATPAPAKEEKAVPVKKEATSAPVPTIQVPVSLVKATLDYISKQPINSAMPIFQQWATYIQSQQNRHN